MAEGGFQWQKAQRFLFPAALIAFVLVAVFSTFGRLREIDPFPIVLAIVLLALTVERFFTYLKLEKPRAWEQVELGLFLILAAEVPLQATGGISSPLYPLKYFVLTILALYFPAVPIVILVAATIGLDASGLLIRHEFISRIDRWILHSVFTVVFVLIFGGAFKSERKWRRKAETRLADINRDARSLGDAGSAQLHSDQGSFQLDRISRESREKREIAQAFDLDERIFRVLEILKRTIRPFTGCLYFWEPEEKRLRLREGISDSDYLNYDRTFKSGEGVIGWVFQNRSPIQLSELDHPLKGISYYSRDEGIHSFMAVPVVRGAFSPGRKEEKEKRASGRPPGGGGEVIGVLAIDSREVSVFTDEIRKLMEVVAHQLVDTIENAEIRHQMSVESIEFAAFYELSKRLSSALRLQEVLDLTLESIREIVPYDFAAIATFTETTGESIIQAARGEGAEAAMGEKFGIEEGLIGWVLDSYRKVFTVGNLSERDQERPVFSPRIKVRGAKSLLAIPLLEEGKVIGSFTLLCREPNIFSEHEIQIFDVLGNQIAISLEKARIYQQVEELAVTDGLTSLANHRRFQEKLREEFARAVRHPEPVSLVLLDLDHFKKINDRYGHPAGDAVLRGLARILKTSAREIDLAARYGGEEFALLLPNTDSGGAVKLAERIRKLTEQSAFPIEGGGKIGVTVSAGVACFPEDAGNPQELLERADYSLYVAKEKGRNRTIPYRRASKERETVAATPGKKSEESDWSF